MNQPAEHVVIEAYEKAEEAVVAMAEAGDVVARQITPQNVVAIVDAAAPIIQRSQRFRTRMALWRITGAAERYLTDYAAARDERRAELLRGLVDAINAANPLLKSNERGESSGENHPTDGPAEQSPAEQPSGDGQGGPAAETPPDGAPDAVVDAARAAATDYALRTLGTGDLAGMIGTAIDATWREAHRLLVGMIAYETTCVRCVEQLDQLAAERAAGLDEGRRSAASDVRRYAARYTPDDRIAATAHPRWHLLAAAEIAAGPEGWAPEDDAESAGDAVPPMLPGDDTTEPTIVRMFARDAAVQYGPGQYERAVDAAITATWDHARRLLTHPGRLTAADRVDTVEDLRARAARDASSGDNR